MTQRPDILENMHKCLLVGNIGVGRPALSLSSAKKSKLAAHGQGGVGKVLLGVFTCLRPVLLTQTSHKHPTLNPTPAHAQFADHDRRGGSAR
jgi:hypothetical protein